MSKKTLTIIIVVSLISLLGGVGVMFFNKGTTSQETVGGDSGGLRFRDFFTIGGGNTPEENTPENENTETPLEENTSTPEVVQKLRQISFEPTTGYGVLALEREIVAENNLPATTETTTEAPATDAPAAEETK